MVEQETVWPSVLVRSDPPQEEQEEQQVQHMTTSYLDRSKIKQGIRELKIDISSTPNVANISTT